MGNISAFILQYTYRNARNHKKIADDFEKIQRPKVRIFGEIINFYKNNLRFLLIKL